MAILVIAEHDNASIKPATLNAVSAAVKIGGEIHLLVAGSGCAAAATAAAAVAGVVKVRVADAAHYADQLAENMAALVVAHAAGYTEGLLFARYATKRDLFVDATARMTEPATRLNQAMSDDLAKRYSWGISDAVMMREFMRPGRERVRTIVLEQYRLASHQPDVQAVVEGGSAPTAAMAASHVVDDPDQLPARTLVER